VSDPLLLTGLVPHRTHRHRVLAHGNGDAKAGANSHPTARTASYSRASSPDAGRPSIGRQLHVANLRDGALAMLVNASPTAMRQRRPRSAALAGGSPMAWPRRCSRDMKWWSPPHRHRTCRAHHLIAHTRPSPCGRDVMRKVLSPPRAAQHPQDRFMQIEVAKGRDSGCADALGPAQHLGGLPAGGERHVMGWFSKWESVSTSRPSAWPGKHSEGQRSRRHSWRNGR